MSCPPRRSKKHIAYPSWNGNELEKSIILLKTLDHGIMPIDGRMPDKPSPQPSRKASRKFRKLWRRGYQAKKKEGLRMSHREVYTDAEKMPQGRQRANRRNIVNDLLIREARKLLNNGG